MPLDVLGRTRATLMHSTSLHLDREVRKPSNLHRDGDRLLQLLIFNEEYLVGACHQRASITSLPFVHTARRSYRLNGPVSFWTVATVSVRRTDAAGRYANLII